MPLRMDRENLCETQGIHAACRAQSSPEIELALVEWKEHRSVLYHWGPATGRWSYNSQISWWAVPPEPQWSIEKSWEALGCSIGHVPGQIEV